MAGREPAKIGCGWIKSVGSCGCGADKGKLVIHKSCGRLACKICVRKESYKAGMDAAGRLMAQGDDVRHVIWSFDVFESRKRLIKVMKWAGATGGAIVYHAFRFSKVLKYVYRMYLKNGGELKAWDWVRLNGMWEGLEYSPHYHTFIRGWLRPSKEVYRETGWVYKNRRGQSGRDALAGRIAYGLSHCNFASGCHSIVYFGLSSYNHLRCTVRITRRVHTCNECGNVIRELPWERDGGWSYGPDDHYGYQTVDWGRGFVLYRETWDELPVMTVMDVIRSYYVDGKEIGCTTERRWF